MRTVLKYTFAVNEETTTFMMPTGTVKLLHVADQRGSLCMWAEVDPSEPVLSERKFTVVGTGWQEPLEKCDYVGTALMQVGTVLHVYECTNK